MTNTITINTSCGSTFETKISELTSSQIRELIDGNPESQLIPSLQEEIANRAEAARLHREELEGRADGGDTPLTPWARALAAAA